MGLAVAKCHRLARGVGLGAVSAEDLGEVQVMGGLKVFHGGAWKAFGAAAGGGLAVRETGAQCASTDVRKQRAFLSDMGLTCGTLGQYSAALRKSLDLVGDFSAHLNYGINGKVWVELKVYAGGNFEGMVSEPNTQLNGEFEVPQRGNACYHAAMLLIARLSKAGGSWETPVTVAALLRDGAWVDVAPVACRLPRAVTVRASQKPSLGEVWERTTWDTLASGKNAGCVVHSREAVGLPTASPGKRAATLDGLLKLRGHAREFFRTNIENKQGGMPWVGTKAEFRQVYKPL